MRTSEARPRNTEELEAKLAGFVRSYIRAADGRDPSQEVETLRWVCVGLERLLGTLLAGRDGWNGWVDGIVPATDLLPDAIYVISPTDLGIRGCAVWGEDARGPFWIEPFLGLVEISDDADKVVRYELKFANAARGLGTLPFGKQIRKPAWFYPEQWLFTFSKNLPTGAST